MLTTRTSRGTVRGRTPAFTSSRRPPLCGELHVSNGSCKGAGRPGVVVAGVWGSCARIACAAVIALVLLGDNTSARSHSSQGWDHTTSWRKGSPPLSSHRKQHAAWQLFAPKAPSPAKRASTSSRFQSRVVGAGSGSAVSPAQMYRVNRGSGRAGGAQRDQRQQQRLGNDSREDSSGGPRRTGATNSIELLQSPRSAELLTVYASAPSAAAFPSSSSSSSSSSTSSLPAPSQPVSSPIAVGIGGGVASRGEGELERPALPLLSEDDLTQLRAGQRVQKQTRQGGSGSGSVVVDVRADPDVVLGLLTKYEDYADMIDTVRQCEVFPQGEKADTRKVEVTVSRFKLHIRVVMSLLRERNMVKFELDPDCTKAGRAVLREATGFFYVESLPDRPGFSRVWMLAKVDVNRFVPGAIVDYAAGRALPRASNWIKPTCEAAQRRKLRAGTA